MALIACYVLVCDDDRVGFNFIRPSSDQIYLLPPDARDWLPPGHLAWRVRDAVDEMDLSGFMAAYRTDGQGAAAFHPAAMVATLLYCYCKGIRSSRAIELASHDDVGVRVILGNTHPDHATVARFVARHRDQMRPLFVHVLARCARDGLVTVDVVAVDGTKVRANASMQANVNAEQLDLDIAGLEDLLAKEVEEWFAQAELEDAAAGGREPPRAGGTDTDAGRRGDDGADKGAGTMSGKRTPGTLARRRAARAKLTAEERARMEQAEADKQTNIDNKARRLARAQKVYDGEFGRQQAKYQAYWQRMGYDRPQDKPVPGGGNAPVAPEHHSHVRSAAQRLQRAKQRFTDAINTVAKPQKPTRVNTTDPDSRIMLGKDKAYAQAYNVQIAVNRNQLILGIATHDNSTDVTALHPQLANTRANLHAAGITTPIGAVLADAGYASAENFTAPCEVELYVAVSNGARRTEPLRKKPGAWKAMAAKLATDHSKALYKLRGQTVEPVFGQLLQRLGRALNYRGALVDAELHLWATSHNLLKLFRRRPNPQTP